MHSMTSPLRKVTVLTSYRRSAVFGTALCALVLGHFASAAEMDISACAFMDEPIIASGKSATQDQMSDTAAAVRTYMGAMQDSLACLERAEKDLGAQITDEQKLTVTAAYNAGVDKLNAIATAYNEQVRAFKNR